MKFLFSALLAASVLVTCSNCRAMNEISAPSDPYPSKALFLGNSITVYPVSGIWWGNWGMAASSREKDYVHVFESKVRASNPKFSARGAWIVNWEKNHETYDLSTLDTLFSDNPDLIVLRMGENVTVLKNFQQSCEKLINYIKSKNPGARIFITGLFWKTSTSKETSLKAAAQTTGIKYIDFSGLDTPENKSQVGAVVQGDDGQEHKINKADVANHPDDKGHQAIADRLFEYIFGN